MMACSIFSKIKNYDSLVVILKIFFKLIVFLDNCFPHQDNCEKRKLNSGNYIPISISSILVIFRFIFPYSEGKNQFLEYNYLV